MINYHDYYSGRDSAQSKNENSQIILKMPGGGGLDPRKEKILYGLFSILTPRCPKRHFSKKSDFELSCNFFVGGFTLFIFMKCSLNNLTSEKIHKM